MNAAFAPRLPLVVALGLFMSASVLGCRSSSEDTGADPIDPATAATGGRKATGGSSGAKAGSSGSAATGGASGQATGSGGAPVTPPPAPAADGAVATDVPAPTETDAAPVVSDATVPATEAGPVVTTPDSGGGVAVCWPDPKVIKICHQLENACENCPPGGAPPKNKTAQVCFDLIKKAYAGMATDADCEKFAIDNKCTVDNVATTGNVCGSLNCYAPGCKDKPRCLNRQQWGDSSMCAPFMATCGPCK